MPSVASDPHAVLPSRSHSPGPRNHAAERSEPATPFAELLDSAAPPAEPPPPAPRSKRADRPERNDEPKARQDSETKPVKDRADAKTEGSSKTDDAAAKGASDTKDAEAAATDAPKADKGDKAASVEKLKLDGEIVPPTDGTDTAEAEVDSAAALAALADAPAPAAPQATIAEVKLAPAAAQTETPEADEFAAIAAANQGPRPGAGTKPADTEASKPGAGAAPASPDAATADAQSGKNAQSGDHGDKPAEFRHAMAEVAKPENASAAAANDNSGAAKASPSAMQHLALTPAVHGPAASAAAANSAVAAAAAQPQAVPVPLSGLAVEIVTQAHAGNHRFEIRLDPPELGRIDVKLDVDRDGNVSTRLVVDRADTLDLLKRDAATLERALQQAGLKTGDHGLDFQLRQHAFAQDDTPHGNSPAAGEDEPASIEAVRQNYGRMLGMGSGLDIRV